MLVFINLVLLIYLVIHVDVPGNLNNLVASITSVADLNRVGVRVTLEWTVLQVDCEKALLAFRTRVSNFYEDGHREEVGIPGQAPLLVKLHLGSEGTGSQRYRAKTKLCVGDSISLNDRRLRIENHADFNAAGLKTLSSG